MIEWTLCLLNRSFRNIVLSLSVNFHFLSISTVCWFNRSSPLHSAEAAFRRLGFSHLGTLRQGGFRFYAHRTGETVGIFAGAALLRMQYICCRYPQTRSTQRTYGPRPATFFQKVALAFALLRESCHGQQPETVPFPWPVGHSTTQFQSAHRAGLIPPSLPKGGAMNVRAPSL